MDDRAELKAADTTRILSRLENPNAAVRVAALRSFEALSEQDRVAHAGRIVSRLEDYDAAVRVVALQTFRLLPGQVRVPHAARIVSLLEDPVAVVRAVALQSFQALPEQERVPHAARIVSLLEDSMQPWWRCDFLESCCARYSILRTQQCEPLRCERASSACFSFLMRAAVCSAARTAVA